MAEENETEATAAKAEELGEAGKKALDAERKARRDAEKLAKELQDKIKAAEDAEKGDVERLQGQVADLTKQAEAATAKADRLEVAVAAGLSPAQSRRLVGSTREELEADAAAMAVELGIKKDEKVEGAATVEVAQDEKPLGPPKEDLTSGAATAETGEVVDAAKLAESILKRSW